MASLALPQIKMPRIDVAALIRNPAVGLSAAAAVFVGASAAVISLLAPMGGDDGVVEVPLAPVVKTAPPGWKQALKAAPHGAARLGHDVVRLSERPLSAAPEGPAARPPATLLPGMVGEALPKAPIAGFFTQGPNGPLPVISPDGRTPAEAYARPFKSNGRPKIALVVGGLGLNARATQQAIDTLRPEITLSFVVYADGLQGWIDAARARGHEVLLETPMEPLNYPDNDPGPYALMAEGDPAETAQRLDWILSRATGYFGLTNYLGSRFLQEDAAYKAFAGAARNRGLAFVDTGLASRRGGGLPRASAERIIDDRLSGVAIERQLAALETGAQQRGQALGTGFAYPVTLEKVAQWATEVEQRGFQLAPASALTAKK